MDKTVAVFILYFNHKNYSNLMAFLSRLEATFDVTIRFPVTWFS